MNLGNCQIDTKSVTNIQFLDDLTPTTFKSITQACKSVTQRVLKAQKSDDDLLEKGEKRRYGDGDLDLEKEKLAKEVSAQLEVEKQKILSSEKPEEDSEVLRRKKKEKEANINDTKNMIAGIYFLQINKKRISFNKIWNGVTKMIINDISILSIR